ncbi:hypothetical protein SD71_00250 [Cohnella kolymensis]|uniref:ABC transporter substrate-binding protein n=1 Tax=Cohnella kolymensis TaxID=1590652 RepID=A0ABR5A857_9BACL|nr:extracellular solute-binding protein [Cohnella kolymensis]KIL37209.1 hypothetical protein SD71_00250 [Cohnella kolymensis]
MQVGNRRVKMKALLILMLAILVMVLAACGSSNNDGNASPSSAAASPDSTPSASTQAAQEKKEVVELEFFQFAPVVPAFEAIIARFEEKYPHINITQNNVPDALKVLDMRMASGDAPDLFNLGASAAYRNYVQNGLIVDLTNEEFMKRVNPTALEMVDYEGKKYGMPGVFNMIGMYYNKKIFNDLGIDVPKTKDELIAAAEKIKAAGITPFVFPDKDVPMINRLDFQAYSGVFTDNPKQIFLDAMEKKTHLTESEVLRKSAQMYIDLRKYSENSLSISMQEGFNQFATGKAAMMPYINFAATVVRSINPELEFSEFPLPGDDPNAIRVPVGTGFQFAISSDSKYIEEAKMFLDFWSQPENAALFESKEMSPSAILGVPSTTKETELMRKYIDEGKTFQWPGERGHWSVSQLNDFATHAQALAQTKDVDKFLQSIDALFYGVK